MERLKRVIGEANWLETLRLGLRVPVLVIMTAATTVVALHGLAEGITSPWYWAVLCLAVVALLLASLLDWNRLTVLWRLPLFGVNLLLAGVTVAESGEMHPLSALFLLPVVLVSLTMRGALRMAAHGLTVTLALTIGLKLSGSLQVGWLGVVVGIVICSDWVIDRLVMGLRREASQARNFRVVADTIRAVLQSPGESPLQHVCDQALDAFGANEATLFLLNEDQTRLLPSASAVMPEYRWAFTPCIEPIAVGVGMTGWVFAQGEPIFTDDVRRESRAYISPGATIHELSAMVLPIEGEDGSPMGVLRLYAMGLGSFTAEDHQLARIWASEVGLVLRTWNLHRKMEQMAMTDALTGTFNRNYLTGRWPQVVAECEATGQPISLLMIDLFNFKQVNDRYGHLAGDEQIRILGRTLLDLTPPGGFVVRYGGDEFLTVLPGVSGGEAQGLKEAIQQHLSLLAVAMPDRPALMVDIGLYTGKGGELAHLLSQADLALYREKDEATYQRLGAILQSSVSERAKHMVQAVMSLTKVQELNDPYTRGHSERAKEVAMRIARQMGMSPEDVQLVGFAAVLHDVGKVVVPPQILHKPGPLTPEEWRIMRMHPEFGANIVGEVDLLRPVKPIILHHHERWDGAVDEKHPGYPMGLKGEQIPLGARIIAVVDAFDAMTTDRVYRKGRSADEALAEIRRMAGVQFDPAVVAAFEQVVHERQADQPVTHLGGIPEVEAGKDLNLSEVSTR